MYLWLCIKNVDIEGSVHGSFPEYAQGQMITKMFWNRHTKEPKQNDQTLARVTYDRERRTLVLLINTIYFINKYI